MNEGAKNVGFEWVNSISIDFEMKIILKKNAQKKALS